MCEKIKQKSNLLFEDEHVAVLLAEKPCLPGHMLVIPKQHSPIIEKVADSVMNHMFEVANKIGIAVFEGLGAHGTNVLVQNGPAAGQKQNHALINVVPRFDKDGLLLAWEPGKQAPDEDLSRLESLIKEHTRSVGIIEREPQKPVEIASAKEVEENDYRARQLRRIP